VVVAVDSLLAERGRWEEINFGLAPADFRERLSEHQKRYEAIIGAVQDLDVVLDREVSALRQQIEAAEERRMSMTIALAIFAFFAAAGALWLGYRLHRSSQQLVRRAQEETALRRVAQTMAEAEDLPGALSRIVWMVAETAAADGAHIEQVDAERGEIEVVAVTGSAAPEQGVRAPYAGSLAEETLTRGEAEQTSVAAIARAERPMASHFDAEQDRYLLIVPLLSEGEAIGALLLTRAHAPFDAEEVQRARLLADMAALVLRRLRLLAEAQAREQTLAATAAELRTLNETLEERVRERTHQAQELSRALTLAEQRERREVAQVLHDDLQQVLYGLQLGLRTLELQAPELETASLQEQLHRTHDLVGEAIEATRRLTVDLSPPILAGEGLVDTLRWLATHIEERFDLSVDLEAEEGLTTPTDDMRVLLFQTVRELLFNAVKHADTDRATVALFERDGSFLVEVSDEGVGFDPATAPTSSSGTLGGFGLRRARERLSLFGGCVELMSAPGQGTRATITIPVERLRSD
jgi:signal transduction histidine kinase